MYSGRLDKPPTRTINKHYFHFCAQLCLYSGRPRKPVVVVGALGRRAVSIAIRSETALFLQLLFANVLIFRTSARTSLMTTERYLYSNSVRQGRP